MTALSDVDSLIAEFFGAGNDLNLDDLAPDLAAWLEARIISMRAEPLGAHVLPRRVGATTRWYGLAHSPRQLRELQQGLDAFVGPTYGRIGRALPLDPTDAIDAAIHSFTGGHALVFNVIPGAHKAVRTSLGILDELNAQMPHRELAMSRPLGRLLREFEMAVVAGLRAESSRALDDIEASGQLSAQNLVFLRMRRLGGLHDDEGLLAIPELATVMLIRRPARVSADLLRAVYNAELARFEPGQDVAGAIKHFVDVVLTRYPGLLKSRHGILIPEAIKFFMLHAAAVHPGQPQLRTELLDLADVAVQDLDFLRAIHAHVGPQPGSVPSTVDEAANAIRGGQFDLGLMLADALPPGLDRAELLIRCAVEIDSLEAMQAAADAVAGLSADQRDALVQSRWYSGPWAQITASLALDSPDAAPKSWSAWFAKAATSGPFGNALQIAERGVVEWSISEFLRGREFESIAASLTTNVDGAALRLMRDGLPFLLQFLDRADDGEVLGPLYSDLLVVLAAEDDLSAGDSQVVVNIVATLLEAGVTGGQYVELVQDVRSLWDRIDSPAHLDAGLEMLDVLLLNPCAAPAERDLFLQSLVVSFRRWHRRARVDQWVLLEDLADELGASAAVEAIRTAPEADTSVPAPERTYQRALVGRTVAIYSLTEGAALRARDFLQRSFDDVTVELSHDHVATARLRTLARTADVFVIATRSAKHAATTYIEAERTQGWPVLYPGGKGSASIIRSVFEFVASE